MASRPLDPILKLHMAINVVDCGLTDLAALALIADIEARGPWPAPGELPSALPGSVVMIETRGGQAMSPGFTGITSNGDVMTWGLARCPPLLRPPHRLRSITYSAGARAILLEDGRVMCHGERCRSPRTH